MPGSHPLIKEIFERGDDKDSPLSAKVEPERVEQALKDGRHKIEEAIITDAKIPDKEFKTVVYLSLFGQGSIRNIDDLIERVNVVETKVDSLEDRAQFNHDCVAEVNEKCIALEIENYENKFLLKNVPMKAKAGTRETHQQTEETVNEILSIAEMDLNDTDSTFRLYPKGGKRAARKDDQKLDNPSIFIKFNGKRQVNKFFSKITEIRKVEAFKNVQFERVCPPSLLADWKSANAEGFKQRKEKNMQTRTEIRNGQVALLIRKTRDERFIQIEYPRVKNQDTV